MRVTINALHSFYHIITRLDRDLSNKWLISNAIEQLLGVFLLDFLILLMSLKFRQCYNSKSKPLKRCFNVD